MPSPRDSPFEDVLHSNYVPGDHEIAHIRGYLDENLHSLSQLEEQIESLQASLDELFSLREELENSIESHGALLSAFRRFPPEVLAEVFLRTLPTKHNSVRSIKEAPLLLTRVCRQWREIAISTPSLWNSLHIYLPQIFDYTLEPFDVSFLRTIEQRREGIELWFRRSGDTLPISLSFVVDSSTGAIGVFEKEPYPSFFQTVARYADRWCALDISMPSVDSEVLLLKLFGSSAQLSNLRSLKVTGSRDTQWDSPLPIAINSLIERAPHLRVLHLTNGGQTPFSFEAIRWEILTELTISARSFTGALPTETVVGILTRSHNLRTCTLMVYVSFPYHHIPVRESICLCALESLNLTLLCCLEHPGAAGAAAIQMEEFHLNDLFKYISTPSLITLTIKASSFGDVLNPVFSQAPFLHLLSSGSLVSLDVELPLSPEAMIQCLQKTPSLKSLTVTEWPWLQPNPRLIGATLVRALMPQPQGTICSSMESLNLFRCETLPVSTLISFASSRWNDEAGDCLKLISLQVEFVIDPVEDVSHEVAELCSQGMAFSLTHPRQTRMIWDPPDAGLPGSSPSYMTRWSHW